MIWAWITLAFGGAGGLAWIWLDYRLDQLELLIVLAARHDDQIEEPTIPLPTVVMAPPIST
jgi:hypothetical protein